MLIVTISITERSGLYKRLLYSFARAVIYVTEKALGIKF